MGTGKSAVGRALAESLGMRLLDSDQEIEHLAGKSIATIFEQEGEAAFRTLERRFIESGHPAGGCVVSTGGGLVTQPGLSELMRANGLVVVLCASPETVYERTRHHTHRPLLQVEDPLEHIRKLMAERELAYREAGIQVMTDNRNLREIVAHIERLYNERCAS